MKTAFIISTIAVLVIGCGSSPQQSEDSASGPSYDTENPTNFADYKKWRAENDPAAEKYAEYKEWEIRYRLWKAQQENLPANQ